MSDASPADTTTAAAPGTPVDLAEVAAGQPSSIAAALRRPGSIAAIAWLSLIIIVSVFAHQLAPYNPLTQNLVLSYAGPSAHHLLGTDELGRDLLSRLIYGGRVILLASAEAVAIALILGVPAGLLAGYVGGKVDAVASFVVNVLFSIPGFVVLVAVAFMTNNSIPAIMAGLGVLASATILRLVRATTQAVRSRQFVDFARTTALPRWRILARHVLPNTLGPLIVQVFYLLSLAFILASSLSFLSLGFNPETPSWGLMVYDATQNINEHSYLMFPVGVVLTATVLSFNQIGSALRGALPQAQRRSILAPGRGRLFSTVGSIGRSATATSAQPSAAHVSRAESTGRGDRATNPEPRPPAGQTLLEVEALSVAFPGGSNGSYRVVDDVNLTVRRGETLGLVGESGSGKTMTALALIGLVPKPGTIELGRFAFNGRELSGLNEREFARLRGRSIAYVSQEPMVALDPCFTVGSTLAEPLRTVRGMSRDDARREALDLLGKVGIANPDAVAKRYPHQLSGGMAQRVAIALALTNQPELLIADEPTTALDVTIQAEILDLLRSLQRDLGMTIILVTHDLGVVADMCTRVAVMYAAQIVEMGTVEEILAAPSHPYTLSLMGAVPAATYGERLVTVEGTVPPPTAWPSGCRFATRCPVAIDECSAQPVLLESAAGRARRCIREPQVARSAIDVRELLGTHA